MEQAEPYHHVVGEPAGALEQRHGLLLREVVQAAVQAPVGEQVLERLLALGAGRPLPVRRPSKDAVHCGQCSALFSIAEVGQAGPSIRM